MYLLALLLCCGPNENPTKANNKSPAIEPSQEEPPREPQKLKIIGIEFSSSSDSHADHVESGTSCRLMQEEWQCRHYLAYHSINPDDLEGGWSPVPRPDDWKAGLMAPDLQEALGSYRRPTEPPEAPEPERGSPRYVSFLWEGGGASYKLGDAPEGVGSAVSLLQSGMPKMETVSPRYRLELGSYGQVGLNELAWLDDTRALKLDQCKHDDVRLRMLENGKTVGKRILKKKDIDSNWEVGGYQLRIEMIYCGRQNYVALTPSRK
jgi:hypothetical protein